MKSKGLYLIAALLVLGAAAVLYFTSIKPANAATEPEIYSEPVAASYQEVVAAAVDIPRGTVIQDDMLKKTAIYDYDPSTCTEAIFNTFDVLGRIAKIDISQGQCITDSMLNTPGLVTETDFDDYEHISDRIPVGMCALAVQTDYLHGVAGYLTSGDTVNIVANAKAIKAAMEGKEYYASKDDASTPVTQAYLAKNVTLLAVGVKGQNLDSDTQVAEGESDSSGSTGSYEYVVFCVTEDLARLITEVIKTDEKLSLILLSRTGQIQYPTGPSEIVQNFDYSTPVPNNKVYTGGTTTSSATPTPYIPQFPGESVIVG